MNRPLEPHRVEQAVEPSLERQHELFDDMVQPPGRTATFHIGQRHDVAVVRRPQAETLDQVAQPNLGIGRFVKGGFDEGLGLRHTPVDRAYPQILLPAKPDIQQIVANPEPLGQVAQCRSFVAALSEGRECKGQQLVLV